MEFRYRARDLQGELITGAIEAEDPAAALRRLTAQGRFPIALRPATAAAGSRRALTGRVEPKQLLGFTRQLSALLHSGLPLLPSLDILARPASNPALRRILRQIIRELRGGSEFWLALSHHPRLFPPVYLGMVRAGEHSGQLDAALGRLSEWLEREQQLRARVRNASVYPIILAVFTVLIVIGILLFIMPLFADLFLAAGDELPALTRALIAAGDLIRRHGLPAAIALLLLAPALRLLRRVPAARYHGDRLLLHIPLLGAARVQIATARFAHTLGALLQAGLPLLTALEITEATLDNAVIARTVARARRQVQAGSSLAAPLAADGVFSPLLTAMIAAGEAGGELGAVLLRSAAALEQEGAAAADALLAALEPLMIVIAAIVVGVIILAVLLPVFDLAGIMS